MVCDKKMIFYGISDLIRIGDAGTAYALTNDDWTDGLRAQHSLHSANFKTLSRAGYLK